MRRLTRTTLTLCLGAVYALASPPAHAQCINGQCSTRGAALFSGYRVVPATTQNAWQSAPTYSIPMQAPVVYASPQAQTVLPAAAPVVAPVTLNANGCTTGCTCGCNAGGVCQCGNPKPAGKVVSTAPATSTPATGAAPQTKPDANPVAVPVVKPRAKAEPPPDPADVLGDTPSLPTGVEADKVTPQQTSIKGRPVTQAEAFESLGTAANGSLPNDATRCVVVATLPDGQRQQLEKDWATSPELAPYMAKCRLQAHDPSDANLLDRNGKPTPYKEPGIWVVTAGGQALLRIPSYMGPAQLAGDLKQLDPAFDGNKVPVAGGSMMLGEWVPVIGAGLGAFVLIATACAAGLGIFLVSLKFTNVE